MAWRIEFDPGAARELDKLDSQASRRILKFLSERIAPSSNPRSFGEALKGSKLGEFWKYRIGDYRIIASIEDRRLLIHIVRIGNRRDVYRQ
ncbi:MAG: type II toxin-antitoxin system RelE/ParE family toxin [Elusimicrobia bacterium]|nr:type II toxin-antitoxin system RelE/ParE family toxin [Elusimicrobiota bacterium]